MANRPPVRPLRPKPPKKPKHKLVLVPLPKVEELPRPNRPAAEEYEPTERQRRFHDVAVRCIATGKMHPAVWLNEYYEQFGERLTAAEFEKWKKLRSFTHWFYADLRYTPDENDLAVADAMFMQKVVEGVARGDPRFTEIYANIRGFRKRPAGAHESDGSAVDRAIDEFKNSVPASGWDQVKK